MGELSISLAIHQHEPVPVLVGVIPIEQRVGCHVQRLDGGVVIGQPEDVASGAIVSPAVATQGIVAEEQARDGVLARIIHDGSSRNRQAAS